jgi:hypothetical protein
MTQNMIYNSINHNLVFLPPFFTFLIYIRRRAFSFVPAITICMYTRHVKNISDWLSTTICMEYGPHFKIIQENRKIILNFYFIRKYFLRNFLRISYAKMNDLFSMFFYCIRCVFIYFISHLLNTPLHIYITLIHILALSKEWQPTQILQPI